jgi:hypothetical protein
VVDASPEKDQTASNFDFMTLLQNSGQEKD